ncbi:MAG: DNA recombination protein RmuC [Phycisphaerae bacterium]
MLDILVILGVLLTLINLGLLVVLLKRTTGATVDSAAFDVPLAKVADQVQALSNNMRQDFALARQEQAQNANLQAKQITEGLTAQVGLLLQTLEKLGTAQRESLGQFGTQVAGLTETQHKQAEALRADIQTRLMGLDDNLKKQVEAFRTAVAQSLEQQSKHLTETLHSMQERQDKGVAALQSTVETRLETIRTSNEKKLDEMRGLVDEKLSKTLDERLASSFKQVSERLEQVHKGLGEMQTLATGVGDLKKVLTNVKTRGTWGEVQLGNLLEQVLTPDQYAQNVATVPNSANRVEFALKLPGRSGDPQHTIWLPIDAKFPIEDYKRLIEAQELAQIEAVESARAALVLRVTQCAKDIQSKYIATPETTDFGVMFLPSEGLFAEVLRIPGLSDEIQTKYRVMMAGPTTLWSLLTSLQMGFRTLAIQERSQEVWLLLQAVKTEWSKYADALGDAHKKIMAASTSIEKISTRTQAVKRKLRDVETMPAGRAADILRLPETPGPEDAAEDEPTEA